MKEQAEYPRFSMPLPPEMERRLDDLTNEDQVAMERAWDLAGMAQDQKSEPDFGSVWSQLEQKIGTEHPVKQTAPDRAPAHRKQHRQLAPRIIGGMLTLFAGLFLVWYSLPITRYAPEGEHIQVALPDGSIAELNSGSTLRYRQFLPGLKRTVNLEGEGYFNVTEKSSPFIVETFNASVQVLGTAFNVRSWPRESDPETRVYLEHGAVQLWPQANPNNVQLLKPGEQVRLLQGSTEFIGPLPADSSIELIWRRGGLSFEGDRLSDILGELQRSYSVSISTPVALEERELTFFLADPPDIESVLDVICSTLSCTVTGQAPSFELIPDQEGQ